MELLEWDIHYTYTNNNKNEKTGKMSKEDKAEEKISSDEMALVYI